MCGRFVMATADSDLVAAFGFEDVVGEELRPSWNVAPTQQVRIITGPGAQGTGSWLETARWGLGPGGAKSRSVGSRAVNARSETVLDKPTFRSAAVKRRARVPAEGYYEWQAAGNEKIPTYLCPREDWLDPGLANKAEIRSLLGAIPDPELVPREVAKAVGNVHNNRSELIEPVEDKNREGHG